MNTAEDHHDMLAINQWKDNNASLAVNWVHHWPILATLFHYSGKATNISGRFNTKIAFMVICHR